MQWIKDKVGRASSNGASAHNFVVGLDKSRGNSLNHSCLFATCMAPAGGFKNSASAEKSIRNCKAQQPNLYVHQRVGRGKEWQSWPPTGRISELGRRQNATVKLRQSIQHFSFGCDARTEGSAKRKTSTFSCSKGGDSATDSSKSAERKFRDSFIRNGIRDGNLINEAKSVATCESPSSNAKATKKFLYFTEGGGQIRASVTKETSTTYSVQIQVIVSDLQGPVHLHWGLFRSDSTDWVLLDPDLAPPGTKYIMGKIQAMQTPLQNVMTGLQTLTLEFDEDKTPLYVHFVLYRPASVNGEEMWIRNSYGRNFCIPVGIGKGLPEPLGCTWKRGGTLNFALYSKNAEKVSLCLYEDDATEPSMEIEMESSIHRTGDVWHIELQDVGSFTRYGYRCKGEASWESGNRFHSRHVLLDPYAKFLAPFVPGQETLPSIAKVLGSLKTESEPFYWEDDTTPCIPLAKLIVYKLNVRGFTADESSGLDSSIRGTFDGLTHKIQHLVNLGVNAVILEPISAYYDNSLYPVNFFCPAVQFGQGGSLSVNTSFKRMVKDLHKNGMEVILTVIYSHTAEGGDESPNTLSFRGIDNSAFYILDEFGRVVKSDSGTENAFNCNHPFVQKMIVDSLRYWVEEFHVDGFLFVNGTALLTGPHRQKLSRPPLVEAISFDPVLANTKVIVDNSSLFTGVKEPCKFPHWGRWCEWNNCFRDDIRRFIRGDLNQLSSFATRLSGSGDLCANGRGPSHAMNFVTSSNGYTLADLVSYSENVEAIDQLSWNCGAEGPSEDPDVLETRVKQVRNFIMALLLSAGVPVLNMGDEYGHSKGDCAGLDDSSSQFLWSYVDMDFGRLVTSLISSLVAYRSRRKDLFQRSKYADIGAITWHGIDSNNPLWEQKDSSFLGALLHPKKQGSTGVEKIGDVYIAFNAHQVAVTATLPAAPKGMTWCRIADTSLPHPDEFVIEGVPINVTESKSVRGTYEFQPNSAVLLEAQQRSIVSRSGGVKFPASKPAKSSA